MRRSSPALLAALALVASSAAGETTGTIRGQATPEAAEPTGTTGGIAVLRSPSSAEVLIRGGEFSMGSPPIEVVNAATACKTEVGPDLCDEMPWPEREYFPNETDLETMLANELEEHPVTLSPYWLDRREVTVGAYRRCAEAGPCKLPSPYGAGAARFDKPSLPIVFVTYDEAKTFCAWRGGRLPTEAEWERAARGAKGRRYPWGSNYNRQNANHGTLILGFARDRESRIPVQDTDDRDGFAELSPVGSFPSGRSAEGLDDLAGNAAEWVSDYYSPRYAAMSERDPKGPESPVGTMPPFHVVRGGSYRHAMPWMRSAARLLALPGERQPWLGFRCARDGS